jgi:hypothetical protein
MRVLHNLSNRLTGLVTFRLRRPVSRNCLIILDSGFHRNDKIGSFIPLCKGLSISTAFYTLTLILIPRVPRRGMNLLLSPFGGVVRRMPGGVSPNIRWVLLRNGSGHLLALSRHPSLFTIYFLLTLNFGPFTLFLVPCPYLLFVTLSLILFTCPRPRPLTSQPSSKYRLIFSSLSMPKQSIIAKGRPIMAINSSGSSFI